MYDDLQVYDDETIRPDWNHLAAQVYFFRYVQLANLSALIPCLEVHGYL